jgi:hypothetical protein
MSIGEQYGPMGCVLDQAATEAVLVAMAASGHTPIFGDARPQLKGYWAALKAKGVTSVLMPRLMTKFYPNRRADLQRRGTCVARGTYRAVMLSYLNAIDQKRLLGRPAVIAYEPIYVGSRVDIGGGRISGDGAVGAWAGQWCSVYGVCERNRYGSTDLSVDSPEGREDLAVGWRAVPAEVKAASALHKVDAHYAKTVEDQKDALAAGFAGAYCRNRLNGPRDANGIARPAGPGAHCEALCGIAVAANGEDVLLYQQSWGNQPSGPAKLKLRDGQEYDLPQGCYGLYESDHRASMGQWSESWHFEFPEGSQWS